MGHRLRQLLATICVASSLALVALGGSDPTWRVLPSNPELWQTLRQWWAPFLDTVAISHDVKGVSYEESGDA
jgi:hypothetical protein